MQYPADGGQWHQFGKGAGLILEAALKRSGIWRGAHHGFRLEYSLEPEKGWERADFTEMDEEGAWHRSGEERRCLPPALMAGLGELPSVIWFRVAPLVAPEEVHAHYRSRLRAESA